MQSSHYHIKITQKVTADLHFISILNFCICHSCGCVGWDYGGYNEQETKQQRETQKESATRGFELGSHQTHCAVCRRMTLRLQDTRYSRLCLHFMDSCMEISTENIECSIEKNYQFSKALRVSKIMTKFDAISIKLFIKLLIQ